MRSMRLEDTTYIEVTSLAQEPAIMHEFDLLR